MKVKKSFEVYEHSELGVSILVQIDYRNKKVSLVKYNETTQEYDPCDYMFNDRSLEYMNGWLLVLKVMGNAITGAKELLKQHEKVKFEEFVDLAIAVQDLNKKEGISKEPSYE